MAARLAELRQLADDAPILVRHVSIAERFHAAETRVVRYLSALLVLAREEPAREREVRQKRHPVPLERRREFFLDSAIDKTVLVLRRHKTREPMLRRRCFGLIDLGRGHVRAA